MKGDPLDIQKRNGTIVFDHADLKQNYGPHELTRLHASPPIEMGQALGGPEP